MGFSRQKIINGKIITPNGIISNGTIIIKDGIIETLTHGNPDCEAEVIDAMGNYVSPGFIDIHVHGGGGYDFMDNTVEAYLKIARLHARYGTTAFTPTTLSCEHNELLKTLELYPVADALNKNGASFIGMHIEGPYFALSQRGAQDPRYIKLPDPDEYKPIVEEFPFIKRWSAAPEVQGAIEFGKYLTGKNVMPAIAHTDAIYEEVLEAYHAGYKHVTHFYSAMSGVTRRNAYRYAGVIESAYLLDDMTVEIIADGIHLPPPLLKLVVKIKGPDKIALITDAMRAAGTSVSESVLGAMNNGLKVIIEDGVAKLPDRSAFAGSVATANKLVYNMINLAGVSLMDAVKMAATTPAVIMGIANRKGSLEVYKDADIVIFDEHINIKKTIIGGRLVFEEKQAINN